MLRVFQVRRAAASILLLLTVAALRLQPAPVAAQSGRGGLEVLHVVGFDVSPPLRKMPALPPQAGPNREIPIRAEWPSAPTNQPDPVVQDFAGPIVDTTAGLNVLGVGMGFVGPQGAYVGGVAPSDSNGAVGDTQYVQWVNTSFAVFDKSGKVLYGPAAGNTLWGSDIPCGVTNDGDPVVQYDAFAKRWILTQLSYSHGGYYSCIAVSQTSDATGQYYRFVWQFTNLNDYPKLGIWPDGYYMSFNMFKPSGFKYSFVGPQMCALERAKMLQGDSSAVALCYQLGSSYSSLLPSDVDGAAPPAGSPNPFLNLAKNSLQLWRFHADFSNYANSSLTGPISVAVPSFSTACGGGTCIPQARTSQQLDSLGDRLMYRLAYRNFGDHESLVTNHSVAVGKKGSSSSVGIRWYELRDPNGTPFVYQQGTFSPDPVYRWMGSIAMDKVGDIAVGYSASSTTISPEIRYTGRTPSDPAGALRTEATLQAGLGSQLSGLSRWGDYSSMNIDPIDDCTFWYTNQYLPYDSTFNWSTRIASFKFPSCQ